MKTSLPLQLHRSLFRQEGAHTVKLIKADEAARLLPPPKNACDGHSNGPRKNPEVRLVANGPDYCDLEVVCGCGDVTRFRCWNTPPAEEKGAK